MRWRHLGWLLVLSGCAMPGPGSGSAPELEVEDPEVDALYTDFLGGKFDGLGHPVGATVFEGEGCEPDTGWAFDGFLDASRTWDAPGVLCRGETERLGRGLHAVNVRAALTEACEREGCDEVALRLWVLDEAGEVLGRREIAAADFGRARVYRNFGLDVRLRDARPLRVRVEWPGSRDVRLEYVEVFRRDRQLVLSPRSGVLDRDAELRIEIVDPPDDAELRIACGGEDRGELLDTLLETGEATVAESEFRRIVTAPLAPIVDGCPRPARLVASLRGRYRALATSEVVYLDELRACPEDDGRPLVVLSGFLPFPAGSSNDNSSAEAVRGFDPSAVEARVLPLVLPVEFDAAAAQVTEVADRCGADVVVGFGQGRWRVDLETTAYNEKDTSDVAGGVPDNRGRVLDGEAIRDDGAPELSTRLPVEAIEARLVSEGVDAGLSDDPGRYICNDVFYSIAHDAPPGRVVGFVHLPIIRRVGEMEAAMLQTVVEAVVSESLRGLEPR